MSLINQMLQDLDSRGTESVGKGAMFAQIRSVPESRSSHPVRSVGLIAAIALLIAVLVWQWMRHSGKTIGVASPPAHTSPLDLKLSSDLSVDQLRAQQPLSQIQPSENNNSDTLATPAPTSAPEIAQDGLADNKKITVNTPASDHPSSAFGQKAVISAPAPTVKAAPVPVAIPIAPKQRTPASSEKAVNAAPTTINKQVNELTAQQRAENEYRKAVLLIQQGRPAEAVGGLEQALQFDPQHVAARQTLVGLLIDAKRQDEGMRKLQDGLNLDSAQPGLAMILARLQVEKGDLRHALETLQRTLPYASERADYQAFLAALLQRDGRHKEAIAHYILALNKTPQNGVWWMGLGISLQAENRLTEAQEAFGRAKTSNALSAELQAFVDQKLSQLKH